MAGASTNSIDSINDVITQSPKSSPSNSATGSDKTSNGNVQNSGINSTKIPSSASASVSSFARNPTNMAPSEPDNNTFVSTTHEPYRPPPPSNVSYERVNPFDKNTTSLDNKPTGIYSNMTTNVASTTSSSISAVTAGKYETNTTKEDTKSFDDSSNDRFTMPPGSRDQSGRYALPQENVVPTKIPETSSGSFDYSYKPTPATVYPTKPASIDKPDAKNSDADMIFNSKPANEFKKPEFKRELSDADIIFGGTKVEEPPMYGAKRFGDYNKGNVSFSTSNDYSADKDYIFGNKKDHTFNKSLSVSSDKDGDFSHDPTVMSTRAYQGVQNDAFSDFDTPGKSTSSAKSWSNNETDDDYDLK